MKNHDVFTVNGSGAIEAVDYTTATKIYSGRDRVCRCGCAGTYAKSNTRAFALRAKKMAEMIASGEGVIKDGGTYINISFGDDRALTAYFD